MVVLVSDVELDDGLMLDMFLALLDRIEIEQDWTLASQRHQIAKDCGYEVVFGHEASGALH